VINFSPPTEREVFVVWLYQVHYEGEQQNKLKVHDLTRQFGSTLTAMFEQRLTEAVFSQFYSKIQEAWASWAVQNGAKSTTLPDVTWGEVKKWWRQAHPEQADPVCENEYRRTFPHRGRPATPKKDNPERRLWERNRRTIIGACVAAMFLLGVLIGHLFWGQSETPAAPVSAHQR
jgi:hypothetical protein